MLTISQILHIVLTVFPLFFVLILLALRKTQAKANKFLTVFMLIIFLQYFFSSAERLLYANVAILGYYLLIPLMLCNAPLLYFYIKGLTAESYKFKPIMFLHFVPAIVVLIINLLSFGNVPYSDKNLIITQQFSGQEISFPLLVYLRTYKVAQMLYNLQVVVYSIMMILLLFRHSINIKNFFSYKENISLNWLKIFVILFVVITFIDVFLYNIIPENIYLLIMIVYIGFLGYFSMKQTDIYATSYSEPKDDSTVVTNFAENNISFQISKILSDVSQQKPAKFTLNDEQVNEIIRKMNVLLKEEKIYRNSKLSLEELSVKLSINKNYLSYIINTKFNKNFYHLINEYRIEEAKFMLKDTKYNYLSIEGIARTVGFNSKSVFNPVFKKITGLTPSNYKKKR